MTAREDLQRLGEYVRRRRTELRLRQEDVLRAGGLSMSSQTKLESGNLKRIRSVTLDKLDLSMEWVPGSAQAILNGGEPSPLAGTERPTSPRDQAVFDAFHADNRLSPRDRAVLWDHYIEILKQEDEGERRRQDEPDDDDGGSPARRIA